MFYRAFAMGGQCEKLRRYIKGQYSQSIVDQADPEATLGQILCKSVHEI